MARLTTFLMAMLMISCITTNVVCVPDGNYWLDNILSGLSALAPYLLTVGKDALDAYLYPRMLELEHLVAEPPPPGQQRGERGFPKPSARPSMHNDLPHQQCGMLTTHICMYMLS